VPHECVEIIVTEWIMGDVCLRTSTVLGAGDIRGSCLSVDKYHIAIVTANAIRWYLGPIRFGEQEHWAQEHVGLIRRALSPLQRFRGLGDRSVASVVCILLEWRGGTL